MTCLKNHSYYPIIQDCIKYKYLRNICHFVTCNRACLHFGHHGQLAKYWDIVMLIDYLMLWCILHKIEHTQTEESTCPACAHENWAGLHISIHLSPNIIWLYRLDGTERI